MENMQALYYTRAFRRRDPNGTLQREMEARLSALLTSSFEQEGEQEFSYQVTLGLAAIRTVIAALDSFGTFYYPEPMLETVEQVLAFLFAWRGALAVAQVPAPQELARASSSLFMVILWKLYPQYVLDHAESPILTVIGIVTTDEFTPEICTRITSEPCKRVAYAEGVSIYRVPCIKFGPQEKRLLDETKARGDIQLYTITDVSDVDEQP